ncbi:MULTISPECIES: alpha/beta fold hydrolase [Salinibaculum]|uniref:alpha/beta hydrolase n=1 Tax=Salinibaculum TaxID=2732368 RepID=UPI0030CB127F
MTERTRRSLLRTLGLVAAGGLAGCGQAADSTATPTTTPTATGTPTATETPEETPTATPDVDIDERARTLVRRLDAGEYESAAAMFAPQSGVGASTLEGAWNGARQQFGSVVAIEGTRQTTVSGFEAVVVVVQFTEALRGVRVVFDGQGRVAGLQFVEATPDEPWSPPAYVDRDAIATTSVTVDSACGLPGEVTVPASATGTDGSGVPSFVLLGGSGPTDLDGSLGPNRPYRDLTWGVASTDGASSLRYTKRTAVCDVSSTGLDIDDEYTDDALAAIRTLRNADGADPQRTAVVGHSLGAVLAPRVAARAENVPGVVLLAPSARPLHELYVQQTRYLAELDGTVTDAEQARIDEVTAAAQRIADLDIPEGETVLGGGRAYWQSLQEYDAIATARQLDVPVLVLFGERDYQVTQADVQGWRDGLLGVENATVETYPSLNHLFVPGEGQSSPEEYTRPGHVSEDVVRDVGEWLSARWQA